MREEPKDADYILITHDHYDHFFPEDIGKAAKAETILKAVELINGCRNPQDRYKVYSADFLHICRKKFFISLLYLELSFGTIGKEQMF